MARMVLPIPCWQLPIDRPQHLARKQVYRRPIVGRVILSNYRAEDCMFLSNHHEICTIHHGNKFRNYPILFLGTFLALVLGFLTFDSVAEEKNFLTGVRDLNTHHLFTVPNDRSAWESRATEVRRQILVGSGLWPMPVKNPLHPKSTGHYRGDGFLVENIALETWPGFYLCGNLYRPADRQGPFPAIVNPHGHWENGRLHREEDVPLADPPPAPPAAGQADLTAIGIHLARQGFIVFSYDMIGYTDTVQFSHKFAGGLQHWLWGASLSGFQLWNSIRVVDYLQSLPDVDAERIGATGASGGGSQTFLLSAVDERIKVSVPVNMVSAYMQGGCLCENGPGLRVGTDNVEIAALMAPRPMLLVAATGDWTKNVPQEEYPAIRQIYSFFRAEDRIDVKQFNYKHNYNRESRDAMYTWFRRWLLPPEMNRSYRETAIEVDISALHVWSKENPLPADALNEENFFQSWIERSQQQLVLMRPKNKKSLETFRTVMQPSLAASLSVHPNRVAEIKPSQEKKKRNILLVSVKGSPTMSETIIDQLTQKGIGVDSLELPALTTDPTFLWDKFYSCYNRTPLGDRVQAIVNAAMALKNRDQGKVTLVGYGSAGLWVLLARGLLPFECRAMIDANAFDNRSDQRYLESLYAPALRRIGALETAAWLQAKSPLVIFHTAGMFQAGPMAEVYRRLGTDFRVFEKEMNEGAILRWLRS